MQHHLEFLKVKPASCLHGVKIVIHVSSREPECLEFTWIIGILVSWSITLIIFYLINLTDLHNTYYARTHASTHTYTHTHTHTYTYTPHMQYTTYTHTHTQNTQLYV